MSRAPSKRKTLRENNAFRRALGIFYTNWATLDLTVDYAIGEFLNVTAKEAHLITAGMMFGRKARLLADLIGRSAHPRKAEILGAFNQIRGVSKREVFAHGYIGASKDTVSFLERTAGGEFSAKEHVYTLAEFRAHTNEVSRVATAFSDALGVSDAELDGFATAALSLNRKSKTSPGAPNAKA